MQKAKGPCLVTYSCYFKIWMGRSISWTFFWNPYPANTSLTIVPLSPGFCKAVFLNSAAWVPSTLSHYLTNLTHSVQVTKPLLTSQLLEAGVFAKSFKMCGVREFPGANLRNTVRITTGIREPLYIQTIFIFIHTMEQNIILLCYYLTVP